MRYRFIVILLALASTTAFAEIYRWVDPATGRTVISDTAPPKTAKNVNKSQDASADTDSLPFATKRAVENFPVILYSATDCADDCRKARDFLNARGVPFTEKMVQKQEDIDELKALVGDAFVPSLKVGKQSQRGFLAESYKNLLDLAGYPSTAPYGSKPAGGLAK